MSDDVEHGAKLEGSLTGEVGIIISVAFVILLCIFFTYATYLADLHSPCKD